MNGPARQKRSSPDPIDMHVGSRVKLQRKILNISQTALADKVGVTFQQIQKYERGANRISASRLYEFSQVLDVPVSFFFDDIPEEIAGDRPAAMPADPMARREVLELVRVFHAIGDTGVRKSLFGMVKALTKAEDENEEATER